MISDSARECFSVAVRAHVELDPSAPFAGAEADAALYRRFLELMPLGNRAEDFGVALTALARGERLADQAAYDRFYADQDPARLQAFHERFYREREAWIRADPAGWLGLLAAYPGIPELLRRRAGDTVLAIATAKDRASVRRLLEAYGCLDLFPDDRVLDKETGVSKRSHLSELARRLGLACQEITFVDDKLNHLESVASLGVHCVLAAWGYNGERERAGARAAGYPVCRLEDFEAALFQPGGRS